MTVVSPICDICATSAREVQFSHMLERFVCFACYEPHAPRPPADWVAYEPELEPARAFDERAYDRMKARMLNVAPVATSRTGLVGSCPLCRAILHADFDSQLVTLECEDGCDEDAIWQEFGL